MCHCSFCSGAPLRPRTVAISRISYPHASGTPAAATVWRLRTRWPPHQLSPSSAEPPPPLPARPRRLTRRPPAPVRCFTSAARPSSASARPLPRPLSSPLTPLVAAEEMQLVGLVALLATLQLCSPPQTSVAPRWGSMRPPALRFSSQAPTPTDITHTAMTTVRTPQQQRCKLLPPTAAWRGKTRTPPLPKRSPTQTKRHRLHRSPRVRPFVAPRSRCAMASLHFTQRCRRGAVLSALRQ